MIVIYLALFTTLIFFSGSGALEIPALKVPINDFAKMMPPASVDDLTQRLRRIRSETGYNVVVLTVQSIEGEDMESFGGWAFKDLPLTEKELQRSALLIVARKEQKVGVQTGAELRSLFPQPEASRKLQAQVEIYFNGMRPDLGIHAGVHYILGVIKGDFRLDRTSEEEKLENASKRGAGAGAIFAVLLAPFLAFCVGMLWGVYATDYGVQRGTRLFIGAVLGGGTAKIVSTLMAMIGSFSDGLWYFILALSVPLAVFGSLTEYWMGGDWSGIPRVKDKVKRKPEDNMGI
ncbi:MAG TPA: TPM domain-containing protein [Candidatus Binatia bacterium]|nr:TPM domain-containing protein [Candidatus Binatia bacterium]